VPAGFEPANKGVADDYKLLIKPVNINTFMSIPQCYHRIITRYYILGKASNC